MDQTRAKSYPPRLILIAENEPLLCDLLERCLRVRGFAETTFEFAAAGEECLEKVKELDPDLLVLSVGINGLNGWQVLHRLRQDPRHEDLPILMQSAVSSDRDILRGLGGGVVRYIGKPFGLEEFVDAINSVLGVPTALPKSERDLEIERRRLSLLQKVSELLLSSVEMDELLEVVARELAAYTGLPLCAVIVGEGEPYIFARVYATTRYSGTGKTVRKDEFARTVNDVLKKFSNHNRTISKLEELPNLPLADVFPDTGVVSDGYILPFFDERSYLGAVIVAGSREFSHSYYDPQELPLSTYEEELLAVIASLIGRATARARSFEKLKSLSETDALTGVFNRGKMVKDLDREMEEARRTGRPLAFLMTDIDHFKAFNDSYGHSTGDVVLREVAMKLAACVDEKGRVYRYGGEEFTALLSGVGRVEALEIAEELRAGIETLEVTRKGGGDVLRVTISLGVALFPEHAKTSEAIMIAADLALYRAKTAGRNCVRCANEDQKRQ